MKNKKIISTTLSLTHLASVITSIKNEVHLSHKRLDCFPFFVSIYVFIFHGYFLGNLNLFLKAYLCSSRPKNSETRRYPSQKEIVDPIQILCLFINASERCMQTRSDINIRQEKFKVFWKHKNDNEHMLESITAASFVG